jgi:hypothetical protein
MSTTKLFRLFFLTAFIILFCAMATAQVKIKERVEISPANTVNSPIIRYSELAGITLPPIDPEVTALSSSGGFLGGGYDCEDPNADLPFTSRIGGNLRIALFQCAGCVDADIYNETLLIFGPNGNIRHIFPMALFDSCMAPGADGGFHIYEGCFNSWYNVSESSGGCLNYFNPFIFFQSAYEQALERDGWANAADFTHPPDRLNVPIKPWEPLRFRLYSEKNGILYKCVNCFYHAVVMGPDSIVYAGSWTQLPEVLVFRSGDYDVYSHYDPATVFPLNFVRDSSVTGPAPSSIETPYPAIVTDSGMYRIIMAAAKSNTHRTLTMTSPVSQVIFPDIQSAMGDTVLVGPFNEGTQIQLELSGCRTYIREMDYGQFRFQYENWTDYDFGDAIVDVQYAAGRPDHLELWSNTETIYYGDTIDVDVVPCDKDSLFAPLGPDCYYEFSVELTEETSKYVELIYDDVGSTLVEHIPSENRRGIGVRLAANKLEPDSVVDLTFHLTASEFGEIGAASVIPTTTQPTKMAKLSKDIHIKMKSGDASIKNVVDQKIADAIASKVKLGQKKEDILNSKPAVYHKKKIGHLISRQGSSSTNQKSKLIQVKDASTNEIRYSIANGEPWNVIMENDWGMGINPPQEIILGETIYFQAVKDPIQTPNHEKNILIVPLKKLSDKIASTLQDAKFTVSRFKGDEDKLGVYYDTKIDSDGTNLEPGIIRLVGRYWKPGDGNEYIVKLEASTWDRFGHMYVQVKKPIVLGDPSLTDENRHTKVKDVLGNDLWLDEWIIKYAGEYGIFPQIIKAQIQCESNFKPAYRWEPFKDAEEHRKGNFKGSRYNITLDPRSEGNPPIPWEDHKNARPIYPHGEYMTIWDRFYNNSTWLNPSASSDTYNGKRPNGEYIWSIDDADGWENQFIEAMSDITNSVNDARTLANKWLHDKYSKIDQTAQTRIVASYGFLQMLYTSAVYFRNYHKDLMNGTCYAHLPEYLNETENNFNYAVPYLASILSNVIKDLSDKDGNWPLGYEATIKIALNSYNGRKDRNSYGKNVLNLRNIYYPNLNITR